MRPHTAAEAAATVELIESWQETFLSALGRRMVFPSDEYYLLTGGAFPHLAAYEDLAQVENGVGIAAAFAASFQGETVGHQATRRFLPVRGRRPRGRVPGAPGTGQRDARASARTRPSPWSPAPTAPRCWRPWSNRSGAQVLSVTNSFFGGNIAVAGLLAGEDVAAALAAQPYGRRYLLPDVCLSGGRFLDGLSPADLPRAVEIVPADGASLRRALGSDAARERRRRTRRGRGGAAQRGQEHPGQPHRGPPRSPSSRSSPGVTRDRKVLSAEWRGRTFSVVDTGGWVAKGTTLDQQVTAQAERAITLADVILLVVDTTVGVTDEDAQVASILRRSGRPALVVANKVDADTRESDAWTFERLGLGDPVMVSALHGRGAGDLLDEVVARLPPETEPGRRGAGVGRGGPDPRPTSSPSPSWAGPTWASRPCSTA